MKPTLSVSKILTSAILTGTILLIPACSKKGAAPGTTTSQGSIEQTHTNSNNVVSKQNSTTPAGVTSAESAESKSTAPEPKQCFTAQFTPKAKLHGEMSTAVLALKDLNFNPKTFCVRVNGTPVKHHVQLKKGSKKIDAIRISDIAVATAKITVSYCLGKDSCNDDCKIPKDEFMDALGAADDGANKGWGDAADAEMVGKVSAEIQRELADDSQDIAELIQSNENLTCGNALAVR